MLSFGLGILEARTPRKKWWLLLIALPLAAYNHLALEYFFLLEFLRPMLLWFSLQDQEFNRRRRLLRVLAGWAPFLLVWAGALVWRFFIFDYQTNNYEIGLLDQLRAAPLAALWKLFLTIAGDVFKLILDRPRAVRQASQRHDGVCGFVIQTRHNAAVDNQYDPCGICG